MEVFRDVQGARAACLLFYLGIKLNYRLKVVTL